MISLAQAPSVPLLLLRLAIAQGRAEPVVEQVRFRRTSARQFGRLVSHHKSSLRLVSQQAISQPALGRFASQLVLRHCRPRFLLPARRARELGSLFAMLSFPFFLDCTSSPIEVEALMQQRVKVIEGDASDGTGIDQDFIGPPFQAPALGVVQAGIPTDDE